MALLYLVSCEDSFDGRLQAATLERASNAFPDADHQLAVVLCPQAQREACHRDTLPEQDVEAKPAAAGTRAGPDADEVAHRGDAVEARAEDIATDRLENDVRAPRVASSTAGTKSSVL